MNDDLRFYLGILKRRYLPFLAVFIAVSVLATVAILAIRPLYRSEATILVEPTLFNVKDESSPAASSADERILFIRQKISAREELLRIAEKYDLFPKDRKVMSATKLVNLMRDRITIEPADIKKPAGSTSNNSIAFAVGFDYEQSEIAARVANELLQMVLELDVSIRTTRAREKVDFLGKDANRLSQTLSGLEAAITKFKLENQDALPDRVPFVMAQLERQESNLKEIAREIDQLKEEKNLLKLEGTIRSGLGDTTANGTPTTLQGQLEALKSQLLQKQATYGPTHPEIKSLKAAIAAVEKQMETEPTVDPAAAQLEEANQRKLTIDEKVVNEKLAAIDRKIALYEDQRQSFQNSIGDLNKILNKSPEVQGKLGELERQRGGLQKSIDDNSDKLQQAKLELALEEQRYGERFSVIEQPIVPQEPFWPKVPKLLVVGYGLAGISGASLVGLLEFLNRSVRSTTDIVRALNRHPMVVVPYIMTKEEGRRRFRKYLYILVGMVAALVLAVLAVHVFFMPLDELFDKVRIRLGV